MIDLTLVVYSAAVDRKKSSLIRNDASEYIHECAVSGGMSGKLVISSLQKEFP